MKRVYFMSVIIFILFIVLLISYELHEGRQDYYRVMKHQSREIIQTVINFREWAAEVEGLYGNTEKLKPNKYLSWHPHRDIQHDGIHLTMVNPSYMTRLVSDKINTKKGFRIRLIGMNPLNPDNKANSWEQTALDSFVEGSKEYYIAESTLFKELSYKYMKPLNISGYCLQCHKQQGFKVGDLAGGISIEIPAGEIAFVMLQNTVRNVFFYSALSLFLLISFLLMIEKLHLMSKEQNKTISKLNEEIKKREMSEKALTSRTRAATQGELLTLVSHHWRQPLNAVSLTLDMIKDYLQEDHPEYKETSTIVNESQILIKDLSNSIDFFRRTYYSNGKERVFVVTSALLNTAKALEPTLLSLSVKLWVTCNTGSEPENICLCHTTKRDENLCPLTSFKLKGDISEFSQVLMSIMKNAYEAIIAKRKKGIPGYHGEIALSMNFSNNLVTITISNDGIGMTKEELERAFDPYFTTKGCDYGRGTGLYIAKNCIEKLSKGSINIQYSDGVTKVIITAEVFS